MSVTLVAGVTGVGLTSVCQAVRGTLDGDYKLLNFGDIMLEQAATSGITTDRSELATLTQTQTRRLQRRAGEFVADAAAESDVILSTHLAVETDVGYLQGLPDEVLQDVSPTAFILVEADPATILSRRGEGQESERKVAFEQQLNRSAALQYAREQSVPVQFLENEGSIEDAAEQMATSL
ncbi:MAG: archaeal adenylate kinase [Halonotius sp. J07HN4]|nr:MAG: archaeal adenylate kinase [Halonotius sp. J07HN4]